MIHTQSREVAKILPHTFDTNARGKTGTRKRVVSMALATVFILSADLVTNAKPPQISPDHEPIRLIRLPMIEGKDIRFTHFSTEQGLSQSRVDHILQDSQGFLWLGTYNGLNRYDGYQFKSYKPEANSPNSIGGVFIHALFQDRSGALWIGADQDLDRFDPVSETFTNFHSNLADPESPAGQLEDITQDSDGILWLATRNGLDRLDPRSGQFTHYRNDPNDPRSLRSNDVRFVFEDRQGILWVATAVGPDSFDRRTGKVIRHYLGSGFQSAPLDRILEDRAGTLWLSATRASGLTSLDRRTGVYTTYIFDDRPGAPGMHGCSAMLEDRHGMLWLATAPSGVVKFDRQRRQFTRYRNDPNNPGSLSSNIALSLLEDREGNIWAGTADGGVNRFSSGPSPFTIYRNEPGNPNSLDEDFVYSVFEDSHRILWVGTKQLNRLDRQTKRYSVYRHDPANSATIARGVPYGAVEDHDGFLWFGIWGGGLNRLDRRTGRFRAYRHDPANPTSLSNDVIWSLLLDREGKVWAGTDDGLNRLDMRSGRFTVFRYDGPIETRAYRVLAEDSDGSIWMGTFEHGVQRLDPRTGKIVAYTYDPKVRNGLTNNRVNAIRVDHSGTLWIGTQNGLERFDRHTEQFTAFTEHDGLPNNAVEGILEDNAGNLWLSTGNGLSKFDPRAGTFKNYYAEDGLAGNEFNSCSGCSFKSTAGEMFFGGVNGITAFYPERVIDNPYVPPVVLTDFRLFNNPARIGENSVLRRSISYTDALTLSHQQNIFSLEFSSLSYTSSQRNHYRHRLEGLETNWNEVGSTQRFVTYTTLPPGHYTFRVQGSSSSGVWNEQGVALRIRILPPWWNTKWFLALCGATLLALLWATHQLRAQRLHQQFNMRLEERVGERTRIARDLHDTLLQSFQGLVFRLQGALNQLPNRPEKAYEVLENALVSADQAIAEGRSAVQELRSGPFNESNLEQMLLATGRELASSQNAGDSAPPLRVIVEGNRRAKRPMIRGEIYRIGRELLRNAYRHAQAQNIEAELRYDDEAFLLIVRDDGKGIDPQVLKRHGRPGHWGLPGLYERAEGIRGRLDIWSEAGAGTEVRLTVPSAVAYEKSSERGRFKLFRKTRIL
jgi:ligand-binding sensor domain-containing protein/signal transduction histidine kinase